MLANALYFKGVWERKFKACLMREEAFFLHDGCVVRMTFMSSTSKQCIAFWPGYKVVRLRYAQQGRGEHRVFSMYIYLLDTHDGLPTLLHKLSAAQELQNSDGRGPRAHVQGSQVHRRGQDERVGDAVGPRAAPALR